MFTVSWRLADGTAGGVEVRGRVQSFFAEFELRLTGASYEEIAKELDLPLGTVKAHIFRARALLYKHLREQRDTI